jgi:hypothetical protein
MVIGVIKVVVIASVLTLAQLAPANNYITHLTRIHLHILLSLGSTEKQTKKVKKIQRNFLRIYS